MALSGQRSVLRQGREGAADIAGMAEVAVGIFHSKEVTGAEITEELVTAEEAEEGSHRRAKLPAPRVDFRLTSMLAAVTSGWAGGRLLDRCAANL